MADRGILFSAPMVRAILDGRKTQTRRLLRNPEYFGCPTGDCPHDTQAECDAAMAGLSAKDKGYAPGDRLWVRETWGINWMGYDVPAPIPKVRPSEVPDHAIVYFATEDDAEVCNEMPRRPSIFMPRWASRITLAVTDVRVERLQAISEADARAEGVIACLNNWFVTNDCGANGGPTAIDSYRQLWDSLHDKPGERWEDDPWVVAVSFDVREGNIDG